MPLANRPYPVKNMHAKLNTILHSKDLSNAEKRDQLRALIPADVFKIDNLNKATPVQLKQLKDGLAVAEALQKLNAEVFAKKEEEQP
jgi:hypothetical protein